MDSNLAGFMWQNKTNQALLRQYLTCNISEDVFTQCKELYDVLQFIG